jgi:hypothetical protein
MKYPNIMQNTKEGIQLFIQMPIRSAGKEVLQNNDTDGMRRYPSHSWTTILSSSPMDYQPMVEQTICRIRMMPVHKEPIKTRDRQSRHRHESPETLKIAYLVSLIYLTGTRVEENGV